MSCGVPTIAKVLQTQSDATTHVWVTGKMEELRGGVIENWAIKWQDVAGDAENEGNLNQRRELKWIRGEIFREEHGELYTWKKAWTWMRRSGEKCVKNGSKCEQNDYYYITKLFNKVFLIFCWCLLIDWLIELFMWPLAFPQIVNINMNCEYGSVKRPIEFISLHESVHINNSLKLAWITLAVFTLGINMRSPRFDQADRIISQHQLTSLPG